MITRFKKYLQGLKKARRRTEEGQPYGDPVSVDLKGALIEARLVAPGQAARLGAHEVVRLRNSDPFGAPYYIDGGWNLLILHPDILVAVTSSPAIKPIYTLYTLRQRLGILFTGRRP